MSFDWAEYLRLAERLVQAEVLAGISVECRQRCAASRAYYAALGRAAACLTGVVGDSLPDDHKFHEVVISRFRQAEEPDWRRVGQWLEELREYRRDADYHADQGNWQDMAAASILRSQGAIQKLEDIFNGPPILA